MEEEEYEDLEVDLVEDLVSEDDVEEDPLDKQEELEEDESS